MKIAFVTPEKEILSELGVRIARIRKQQGFSQDALAENAGIGVATLRRIEAGSDSQMETWIKLIKALDMIGAIDALLPENYSSPMADALNAKKKKRKEQQNETGTGSVWGDEN